jgi:hypothetical protein
MARRRARWASCTARWAFCGLARAVLREACWLARVVFREACWLARVVFREACGLARAVFREACWLARAAVFLVGGRGGRGGVGAGLMAASSRSAPTVAHAGGARIDVPQIA